jgi:hypothetical protein
MALAAVAIIGIRHLPLAAARKRYIRLARRRKGASSFFLPHKRPLLAPSGHADMSAIVRFQGQSGRGLSMV